MTAPAPTEGTPDRLRRGLLWLAVAAQMIGGVLGFGLGAEGVFAGIADDPLARLTLRLAVYANAWPSTRGCSC